MNNASSIVKALQELAHDLTEDSDLVVVLRAQIRIESILFKLIEKLVTNPKALKDLQLDYFGCVSLAVALGLSEEVSPPLRTIGKLRNSFAHKLDAVLDTSSLNNLYKQLSSQQKEGFLHTYREMRVKYPNRLDAENPNKLPPKDRFQLIAVTIFTSLYSELLRLEPAHGA